CDGSEEAHAVSERSDPWAGRGDRGRCVAEVARGRGRGPGALRRGRAAIRARCDAPTESPETVHQRTRKGERAMTPGAAAERDKGGRRRSPGPPALNAGWSALVGLQASDLGVDWAL